MTSRFSRPPFRGAIRCAGWIAIALGFACGTACSDDLLLGDVELKRQTGDKAPVLLKGAIKFVDEDKGKIRLQQPGKVLTIPFREVKGIRYAERYAEPLVSEELPIKFICDDTTHELARHRVSTEVGRWSIRQSVDVDQVTVTRISGDSSGGLTAVSVTGDVERHAEIATATTTVRNLASRKATVWIRLLIESDTLRGHKEHTFSLAPEESKELMVAFTSAGHQVRRVTTDDIQNTFEPTPSR
jgi:hypothetical protein